MYYNQTLIEVLSPITVKDSPRQVELKSSPKINIKYFLLLITILVLSSCASETCVSALQDIKKPAVVFSEYQSHDWYDNSTMVIKDADGELIELPHDDAIKGLILKYNVGDTIK